MHDIKLIRNKSIFFKKKFQERNINVDLNTLLTVDKEYRELIQAKEKLEQEKKSISQKKDKSKFDRSKEISQEISKLNEEQINYKEKK